MITIPESIRTALSDNKRDSYATRILLALGKSGGHSSVYGGYAGPNDPRRAQVARRRAKNKVASRSRIANRRSK